MILIIYRSVIISRKRKLQELYAVCRHVGRSESFPNADIVATWGAIEEYGGANMEDPEKQFLEENDMERFVVLVVIILFLLTYSEVGYSTNLLYHNILLTFPNLEGL